MLDTSTEIMEDEVSVDPELEAEVKMRIKMRVAKDCPQDEGSWHH